MTLREVVHRVQEALVAIRPWPSRNERRAAVEQAQRNAQHSRQQAAQAQGLVAELKAMRRRNHVQDALEVLIQKRAEGQR